MPAIPAAELINSISSLPCSPPAGILAVRYSISLDGAQLRQGPACHTTHADEPWLCLEKKEGKRGVVRGGRGDRNIGSARFLEEIKKPKSTHSKFSGSEFLVTQMKAVL